jgi:predicted metal-dependent HD superfamily phosphohydrolase
VLAHVLGAGTFQIGNTQEASDHKSDMTSFNAWSGTWSNLGVSFSNESLYQKLISCYLEPHRKYHTLQHLRECFSHLSEIKFLAAHPHEIEIALWFHDAIYDTRGKNNEEKSAHWAQTAIRANGLSQETATRVHTLIIATQHDALPMRGDAELIVDADLGILAATPERYAEYETQVRQEYAWVPSLVYKRERGKILNAFLKRKNIYSTPYFQINHEERARENLRGALAALSA